MGVSKVTLDGTTLMDLTGVTVTAEHLDKNETAHDNKGDAIIGSARPNYEIELLMHTYSGDYENDEITTIGGRAFNADTALTSVNCSNVTTLGNYVFNGCTNLESVSLPKITKIPNYAFNGCSNLELSNNSFIFDNITHIGDYAFQNCTSLTSVEFPNVEGTSSSTDYRHGTGMFKGCTSLVSVSFPKAGYWRNKSALFSGCSSLVSVNLPKCTALAGTDQFRYCISLPVLVLPLLGGGNANFNISSYSLGGCTSLQSFDVKNPYTIETNVFNGASILDTLIIRGIDRTTALSNINAFTGTPFASGGNGGTLYVPSSKISDYEAATNWSTILGYENNNIQAIEGSIYETQYADGSPVPQTITKTLTNCSLSNAATTVLAGEEYIATIILNSDYYIDSVTVMMKRVDVTNSVYDDNTETITISEVDGPIVITVTASVNLTE